MSAMFITEYDKYIKNNTSKYPERFAQTHQSRRAFMLKESMIKVCLIIVWR